VNARNPLSPPRMGWAAMAAVSTTAVTVTLATLMGCAAAVAPTSALLTYETNPDGATLYEAGQAIGQAPVTRTYPATAPQQPIRTPLVTAVWPSGAKESYYTILPLGSDRVATIERPSSAPGLATDTEHAKKIALTRSAEERRRLAQAQRDQRRSSERCKQQQSGASKAVEDDC
jgi:hypothetical protein